MINLKGILLTGELFHTARATFVADTETASHFDLKHIQRDSFSPQNGQCCWCDVSEKRIRSKKQLKVVRDVYSRLYYHGQNPDLEVGHWGDTYLTLLSLRRWRLGLRELWEPRGINPIGMLLILSCNHKTFISDFSEKSSCHKPNTDDTHLIWPPQ